MTEVFFDKVTIIVLSYMSQHTIEETLESLLAQTYPLSLLDVIIADDASLDGSQEVTLKWIDANKNKFAAVNTVFNDTNQGIVGNLKGALQLVNTEWVKIIAGDDLLLPVCISEFVKYKNVTGGKVFFSKMQTFINDGSDNIVKEIYPPKFQQSIIASDLLSQRKFLSHSSFSATPTAFLSMSEIKKVGLVDEEYKMMEDYPLWLKLNMSGVRFYFLKEVTVMYRISESVSRSSRRLVNIVLLNDVIKHENFKLKNLEISIFNRLRTRVWIKFFPLLIKSVSNKRNKFTKLIVALFNVFFKVGFFSSRILK